jgi:hypothetical protein
VPPHLESARPGVIGRARQLRVVSSVVSLDVSLLDVSFDVVTA